MSHLLLITNSSVNFLIYCMVDSRFRHCARRLVTRRAGEGVAHLVTAPIQLQLLVMATASQATPSWHIGGWASTFNMMQLNPRRR